MPDKRRMWWSILVLGMALLPRVGWSSGPKHPAKVVVIGLDGVSLNLLEPFTEKGITPHLGALMKEGTRGHLDSIWPLRTPQVWTTIVTGKLPGQHGIWDHLSNTYFNPPTIRTKKKQRVTRESRRSQALWGLLGQAGYRTLSVGWMATWPAEKVPKGVMVAPIELMGDRRQTTIKGSFYSGEKGLVSPKSLRKRVDKLIVNPTDLAREEVKAFADAPPKGDPFYKGLNPLERYVYGLSWSLARAKSVEALTLDLVAKTKPDVVFSYFQCSDSLLHRFWIFHKGPEAIRQRLKNHGYPTDRSEELYRRFGNVVEQCYRDVDARVGRILEATRNDETLVLIVSDHGFGNAPIPHQMKAEPFSGDHLDDGILLATARGIKKGARIQGANVTDITPTVLHWLGLEVGKDMVGKVLTDLWEKKAKPIRYRPSYEKTPQNENEYPKGWPPRKKPRRSADNN